jgi:hypothetical protein
MNNIIGLAILHIFCIIIKTFSTLWFFRDANKKTKIIALVVGQILLHIGLVLVILNSMGVIDISWLFL